MYFKSGKGTFSILQNNFLGFPTILGSHGMVECRFSSPSILKRDTLTRIEAKSHGALGKKHQLGIRIKI